MRKYQYYDSGDDSSRDAYGVNWIAQTFTPETDQLIGSVKLKLYRIGSPGTVKVSIRATTGGVPTGGDLCSGTIEGANITTNTNGVWYEIPLGDGFNLDIGATYAIIVRAPNGSSGNEIDWRADGSSPTYSDGLFCNSSDSGSSWNQFSGVDALFETWGTGPPSPTTVVWGNLNKNQVSSEKIEEAIDRLVGDHNDDPNSHLGTDQSLQSHKAAQIIDHVASSVVTDKIENEGVTNTKIDLLARAYDAIVDINGNGDYTDIQSAIDYVNNQGGGNILILPGTYTLSSNLTLYSNIQLIGMDPDSTEIDANNTTNHVELVGTSTTNKKNIELRGLSFINWRDNGYDEGILKIQYCENIRIKNCIFDYNQEDTGVFGDIEILDSKNIYIERNNFLINSTISINYDSSTYVNIKGNVIKEEVYTGSNTHAIIDSNFFTGNGKIEGEQGGGQAMIINNRFENTNSHGIDIGTEGDKILISGNFIYNAGGKGISFFTDVGALEKSIISNNLIHSCNSHGIYIEYYIHNTTITGNTVVDNGGNGIYIDNSNSQNNLIVANQVLDNTSGQIVDNGTGTVVAHNVTS